ncbi:MAG: hypothetical protein ABI759_29850 [Candidatus Solibacter sp.]
MAKKTTTKKVPGKKGAKKKGHVVLIPKLTFVPATISATDAGCLSAEDASKLVQSSVGGAPHNPDTALKQIFPLTSARQAFCARVKQTATAAGCTRTSPCTPDTTLGEIADALTC